MKTNEITIEFPKTKPDEIMQGDEFCFVTVSGERQKIRFHDYDQIYDIPGLYEQLFFEKLQYQSPKVVSSLLDDLLKKEAVDIATLNVFDFGAGNGLSGEALRKIGIESVIGADIIEAAKTATLRDRPDVYEEYLVVDFNDPGQSVISLLKAKNVNCLVTVGALGFGDIPMKAFINAFNLVQSPGWIAFNIKPDFLEENDDSKYGILLNQMIDSGIFEIRTRYKYRHRFDWNNSPLMYEALVGIKHRDIPDALSAD